MGQIHLKSPAELARMRQAGRVVAEVLRLMADMAEPGVTTEQLDKAALEHIEKRDCRAAFKGYRGYPANVCTSINEEIVHGIPNGRQLKEGDLLKIDVGVVWEDYYGDAATTVAVGEVSADARRLMQTTRAALNAGIEAIAPGARVSEVSKAVEKTAREDGFSVVRDYTGHGIGRALHEEPTVPNFAPRGFLHNSPVLEEGATIAIEPMVNVGTYRTRVLDNGWTVVTGDGELSAHFEHTVAVGEHGPSILTLP